MRPPLKSHWKQSNLWLRRTPISNCQYCLGKGSGSLFVIVRIDTHPLYSDPVTAVTAFKAYFSFSQSSTLWYTLLYKHWYFSYFPISFIFSLWDYLFPSVLEAAILLRSHVSTKSHDPYLFFDYLIRLNMTQQCWKKCVWQYKTEKYSVMFSTAWRCCWSLPHHEHHPTFVEQDWVAYCWVNKCLLLLCGQISFVYEAEKCYKILKNDQFSLA